MEFRTMTQEDIPACAGTLMAAFAQPPWNENWTQEQAITRIDEIMSARVSRGYVAVEGETVVSMLSGRIMTYLDFKELWVDEFSVHPSYQRKDVGSRMLAFVRGQLMREPEKISCIVLNTERGYPSVKFYEANGFRADESLVFMAADVRREG
ncbi:MAG: GNAT family N-acetyltransferase [Aristaeellaceae bacterium]